MVLAVVDELEAIREQGEYLAAGHDSAEGRELGFRLERVQQAAEALAETARPEFVELGLRACCREQPFFVEARKLEAQSRGRATCCVDGAD